VAVIGVLIYESTASAPATQPNPLVNNNPAVSPPASPAVYLNPRQQSLAKGDTFTVEIRENSGTSPVNAVQTTINYPTDKVSFVKIDASASPFKVQAVNNGGDGKVTVTRGVTGSLTGDQLVAKVTFKAEAAGSVDMTLSSDTAIASSTTNQSIITGLSDLHSASYTIR
jgi:hypothetical protein